MNPRAKQNIAGMQIIDIRKADIPSTVESLDLKPLGAGGLALLKEAGENIAIKFDYQEGEKVTDEQTILTILATYLADFVEKTSPATGSPTDAKLKGAGTTKGTRGQRGQNDKPNGSLQGGPSEVVSHAA